MLPDPKTSHLPIIGLASEVDPINDGLLATPLDIADSAYLAILEQLIDLSEDGRYVDISEHAKEYMQTFLQQGNS
jgi:hypothetical protein